MASFKFVFIALLAVGTFQCQAANVPQPEDLDLFLAAQQVIKIVRNVVAAVDKGIADSKPSVDILVNQLTPEVGKAVKKVIDDVLELVKKEEARIEFMIKEFEDLINAVKKIKSCTDPVKKDLENALAKMENGLLTGVRKALVKNQSPLDDVKAGITRLIGKARKIFDDGTKNIIGCIQPGQKDAKKCVNNEIDRIKKEAFALATDALLFLGELEEVLLNFAVDVVQESVPVVQVFLKESDPILDKISDCIAKMKP